MEGDGALQTIQPQISAVLSLQEGLFILGREKRRKKGIFSGKLIHERCCIFIVFLYLDRNKAHLQGRNKTRMGGSEDSFHPEGLYTLS